MAQSEAQSWIDELTCTAEANIASAALPHGFAAERPVAPMAAHVIARTVRPRAPAFMLREVLI